MFANIENNPDTSDLYTWSDYVELRALIHPDKCFTRGELASLLNRSRSAGGRAFDASALWADIKKYVRIRIRDFGPNYAFALSADEDTVELVAPHRTDGQNFYLTLLICSSMAYLPSKTAVARSFEECSLRVFEKLMPHGAEVHAAWAGAGGLARYTGSLPEKYRAIARDIRAFPTFYDRDFKEGDHGDGGIDMVAWHGMGDDRVAIPSALAQCGCSREDWRRKHLEASPSKLRAKLNPHHPWSTYYFMPVDLRFEDGDWANKSDFGDAIMVDRLRMVRLADAFGLHPGMPIGGHVTEAYGLAIL